MKTIEQEYRIAAPIAKVWQALVDPKLITEWGGGPAEMDAHEGSQFTLWGGDIYGKNVKVSPPHLLVQGWYDKGFKEPSNVTFELKEAGEQTILRLTQTDVPDNRVGDIDEGWREFYLGPLKQLLEN